MAVIDRLKGVNIMQNAGLRLWKTQKHQGTGLCVGLDPHYDPNSELNADFYNAFADRSAAAAFRRLFRQAMDNLVSGCLRRPTGPSEQEKAITFLTGLTNYYMEVIDAAWACGIRIYKPQAAFYERLAPYGMLVLEIICCELQRRAAAADEPVFLILDAKRGDIDTTQLPYYDAYLTDPKTEVVPGLYGRFGFDTMTVTTWMGSDVLAPGLPFFYEGKGAIVVTRTSNPSGTSLQDLIILPNDAVELADKQKRFALTEADVERLKETCNGIPTTHEAMLYLTEQFSHDNSLVDQDGVGPLFSVMGSTVKMTDTFRKIRPNGIALVPGFGAQGGKFDNVMPLLVQEGPLAGLLGILASSRDHNFPWMKKSGGSGDPKQLKAEMERAIDGFRKAERHAYENAGARYPF